MRLAITTIGFKYELHMVSKCVMKNNNSILFGVKRQQQQQQQNKTESRYTRLGAAPLC